MGSAPLATDSLRDGLRKTDGGSSEVEAGAAHRPTDQQAVVREMPGISSSQLVLQLDNCGPSKNAPMIDYHRTPLVLANGIGIVGKCLGTTMRKGLTKHGCKIVQVS